MTAWRAATPPFPAPGRCGRLVAERGAHRLCPGVRSDSAARARRLLLDHAPVPQEHHPVGPRGQLRVVGHHHDGQAALARPVQQAHDLLGVRRVQRAGRLVGQHQLALTDHRAGDRHPLPLAAGQLVGVLARAIGQAQAVQGAQPSGARLPGRGAVKLQRQGDVLRRGEPRQQVEVLEHVADRAAAQPRLVVRDIFATAVPPMSTSPLVGSSRVPAMVSNVLLPDPLGPITATSAPASTDKLTSSSACTCAAPSP